MLKSNSSLILQSSLTIDELVGCWLIRHVTISIQFQLVDESLGLGSIENIISLIFQNC